MIEGHGDDVHIHPNVRLNFSSNIYAGFDHQGLFEHLKQSMHLISNYPEPSPFSLEKRIAEVDGVAPDCVMVTNGATEAIYLIARSFGDYKAVIPQPTFSEYADAYHCCQPTGLTDTVTGRQIWWFCIPNNPTGHVMSKVELIDKISNNPDDLFVVDASYMAYTKMDVISADEAVKYCNVIMLRSMTKDYCVPGIRLGYIEANSRLLDQIRANRMPWSVNALAIEAGGYLLDHHDEYRIPIDELIIERKRIEEAFHQRGIATSHSDSHMLLCELPNGDAFMFKRYLIDNHGILIRDASNFATLNSKHFRIAVQKKEQNDELLNVIDQCVKHSVLF